MTQTPPLPELLHFFSWATGVSVELPVGFERVEEGESFADYADRDDERPDAPVRRRLRITVVGSFDPGMSAADRRDAAVELADGFAAGDGEVLRREELVVDDELVALVVVRRPDGTHLHLAAVATRGRLVSWAGSGSDEGVVADLDAALAGARFVGLDGSEADLLDVIGAEDPTADDWVSVTSTDLLVSLRIPRGWSVEHPTPASLRVYGEPDPDEGFRPTLSVEAGEPEEPGHPWFEQLCAAVLETVGAMPEVEVVETLRLRLSSQAADALLVSARYAATDDAPQTAQLQGWIWLGSTRMLLVGGATLRRHEARDLPVLAQVVRSLRVLPRRPA